MYADPGNIAENNVQTSRAVNDGIWHHVVGTYDGAALRIYLDGKLQAQTVTSGPIGQNADAMTIGLNRSSIVNAEDFLGQVDEVAVYNTALSAARVAAHAVAAKGGVVQNAGFESNQGNESLPDGWLTITNSYGAWNGGGILSPRQGSFVLHPGADFQAGGRYQDIVTAVGQRYRLEFDAVGFPNAGAAQQGVVQVGAPGSDDSSLALNNSGDHVDDVFTVPRYTNAASWTHFAFEFTASDTLTRLSFQNLSLGGTSAVNVDSVALVAVPEPATVLLLGLAGLAWVAANARRRAYPQITQISQNHPRDSARIAASSLRNL
jgi:hypothetical protein